MKNVVEYLHSVFDGWMQYASFYKESPDEGFYAVHKEGLLFMVWLNGCKNYARITLCKVQEPNRELAHKILSEVTEYCIEHFEGWAWVYPHRDRSYSSKMIEKVDLCCGGYHNSDDIHFYDGRKSLEVVLQRISQCAEYYTPKWYENRESSNTTCTWDVMTYERRRLNVK